jgi:hypothetical protein
VATTSWQITLDRPHVIVLEHGYFSARRRVTVDGREILSIRPPLPSALRLWNTVTEHPFTIDGHPCAVRVDPSNAVSYQFDLVVDGRSQKTGQPVAPLPYPGANGSREGRWMFAGFWWALPPAFLSVMIGMVGNRVNNDTLLYVAGFVGMGLCLSIGRTYVDRPLMGVLRCVLVLAAVIALTVVRTR